MIKPTTQELLFSTCERVESLSLDYRHSITLMDDVEIDAFYSMQAYISDLIELYETRVRDIDGITLDEYDDNSDDFRLDSYEQFEQEEDSNEYN